MPGLVPQVTCGASCAASISTVESNSRAAVAAQGFPARDAFLKRRAARDERPAFEIGEGGVVGRDHAGAGAAFDAHVADGHARFHGKRADGFAGVFDDVVGAAGDADLADEGENQILGGNAGGALAAEDDLHGLRARLQQALRGQHVLDFAGADAEGQRAEGAVRGGVAIAADDGQAGLRDAELGTDDVDDALVAAGHVKERDAVPGAILRQRFDLQARVLVHNREMAILGGDGMVHHREGEIGAAHLAAGGFQAGKGLRGGDFVNQVAVNVDEGRLAGGLAHHVRVPNFFVHGLGRHKKQS